MAAMQDELNALRRNRQAEQAQRNRKIAEVERKISGMMRAIEDGLYESAMKERLTNLKAERSALEASPEQTAEDELVILAHPNLPALYRRKVQQLEAVLEGPDRAEAMELIRSMIERVDLHPRGGGTGLDAVLHGDLAAILAACTGAQTANAPDLAATGRQLSVVAGTRRHLYRTRIEHQRTPN